MKIQRLLYVPLLILILLAGISFYFQYTEGLEVTGLKEPVNWGLYVVSFTFCIGLGAGLIIMTALSWSDEKLSKYTFLYSSLSAFLLLCLAGVFVLLDLGRIDRFYYIMIYPQLTSPLFWDFIALHVLMFLSVCYTFAALRRLYLSDDKKLRAPGELIKKIVSRTKGFHLPGKYVKALNIAVIILTIGVYFVTTDVFISLKAHPAWNTPLLSLVFISSVLLAGAAFYVYLTPSEERSENIVFKLLIPLAIINVLMVLLKMGFDNTNPLLENNSHYIQMYRLLIAGNVIPIFLLYFRRGSKSLTNSACILILIFIFFKRFDVIISPLSRRWLPFADVVVYKPTFVECSIVFGVFSAMLLALFIIKEFLYYIDVGSQKHS